MKENEMKKGLFLITLGLFFILILTSCTDNNYPPSVYDENKEYLDNPVITAVDPPLKTFQGVGVVEITGENFLSDMSRNQVTFNGEPATIFRDQSDENKLVVKVPNVITDPAVNLLDSVLIRVAVNGAVVNGIREPGSLEFAVYPTSDLVNFQLERAAVEWGGFADLDLVHAVASDANENLYVATEDKLIFKVDSVGVKSDFGTSTATIVTGMKVGWNGDLFYARNYKFLYRLPASGGTSTAFNAALPDKGKAYDLDFDANGNMIVVGKGDQSIWVLKSDASMVSYSAYTDFELVACKVYNGYIYVVGVYTGTDATEAKEGIWKSLITASAESEIGTRELVFDWATYVGEDGPALLSLAINEDGLLLLGAADQYSGTDFVNGDAITVYNETTATASSLYSEVLYPPSTNFCWGNSNYLYVVRNVTNTAATGAPSKRLIRVALGYNGAPYYGRSL